MSEKNDHFTKDLVFDLNFVPNWAKEPPGQNPYTHFEEKHGRDRRTGGHGKRNRFDRSQRSKDQRRRDTRRPSDEHRRQRGYEHPHPSQHERTAHEHVSTLPLDISFIPERNRLAALVRDLRKSKRAYPLMDIASRFLNNPACYMVKIESRKSDENNHGIRLFQCKECKQIFSDYDACAAHIQHDHLDVFFDVEQIEAEPPAGNFLCVARCRKSGILLGPPNYHGYNEKVQELWRERYSHMTLDAYRKEIETVREPELIEKWKDEARIQTIYKLTSQPELEPMKKAQAEEYVREHMVKGSLITGKKFIMPAVVAQKTNDTSIRKTIRDAWHRESRYPFTLSLALRPAFRHMHLYLFKVNRGQTFVSAIKPHPIDADNTISTIREVLLYLQENPGSTKQQLLEDLRPGLKPEDSEVTEILKHLIWLTERGHVLVFFDGTLSVPAVRQSRRLIEKKNSHQ